VAKHPSSKSIRLRAKQQQRHEPSNHGGKASANEPGQHTLVAKHLPRREPNGQTTDSGKASAYEPSSNGGTNRVTTAAKHLPTNRANTLSVAKHLPHRGPNGQTTNSGKASANKPGQHTLGSKVSTAEGARLLVARRGN